jgi:hypothetical protein
LTACFTPSNPEHNPGFLRNHCWDHARPFVHIFEQNLLDRVLLLWIGLCAISDLKKMDPSWVFGRDFPAVSRAKNDDLPGHVERIGAKILRSESRPKCGGLRPAEVMSGDSPFLQPTELSVEE